MVDLKDIRILVIDDEIDLRNLLCSHLESCGAIVFRESDGIQGFNILVSEIIDVVVSDIRMPGPNADGITLLRKVREGLKPPPPIILISGFADVEYQEALDRGAYAFIPKPFSIQHLDSAILEAITSFPLSLKAA